jgi:hypothetical protein
MLADDQFRNPVMQAPFTDVVLLAGDAKLVGHLDRMMNVLRQADAESKRPGGPRQFRFDVWDQTADQAIYDKLESLYLPEWEEPITFAHLAAIIEEHSGVPVVLHDDVLPSARTDAILGQRWPMITVSELLRLLRADPGTGFSWFVTGGRLHIGRRSIAGASGVVGRVLVVGSIGSSGAVSTSRQSIAFALTKSIGRVSDSSLGWLGAQYGVEDCGDKIIVRTDLVSANAIQTLVRAASTLPADQRVKRVDLGALFSEREGRSEAQTQRLRQQASLLPLPQAQRWSREPQGGLLAPTSIVSIYHAEALHDRIWNAPGWMVIRTPNDPPHPGVAATIFNELDARLNAQGITLPIDFRSSLSSTSMIVFAPPETQAIIEATLREIEAMPISRINTLDYRIIP